MKVSAIDYSSNVYPQTSGISQSQGKRDFSAVISDNASIFNNGPTDAWKELNKKYDIHNASFDDLCNISKSLYSAGQISILDYMTLTFDWKRAADYFREMYPGTVPDLNQISADGEGRRDWIAEFDARAKRDFRQNNIAGYAENQKLAKILRQIYRG